MNPYAIALLTVLGTPDGLPAEELDADVLPELEAEGLVSRGRREEQAAHPGGPWVRLTSAGRAWARRALDRVSP